MASPQRQPHKTLALLVGPTFAVPSVFHDGTQEEIEEALGLGAFVQAHVRTERATADIKTLQARKEAELTTLKQTKDAEIAANYATIVALRGQIEAREGELQKHQRQLAETLDAARTRERERAAAELIAAAADARAALEAMQRRAAAAEDRRTLLEAERSADIAAAEDRTRAAFQQALAIREEQVRAGQEILKTLDAAYRSQVDELRNLNEFVRRKTQNVKTKGNEYETDFRDILIRTFGILDRFAVADTAKNGVGHAGDFLVQMGDHTTLWEVKNYDKTVPKIEVEKFRRDMGENKGVRVGVMVSKGTDIAGKTARGDRELEFMEGKLLIYISRFDQVEQPEEVLRSLLPLFQVWWELQRDDETAEVFKDTVKELDRLLADLTRRRQEWRVHRSRLEETIRWMSDAVEETESRVESLLKMMRAGKSMDAVDIPEGVFRSLHVDERIRETVGALLEAFAPAADAEVRLSDLTDVLASKKKLSKDTARKHVLAALLDTAVVAAPGKPTWVRGLKLST